MISLGDDFGDIFLNIENEDSIRIFKLIRMSFFGFLLLIISIVCVFIDMKFAMGMIVITCISICVVYYHIFKEFYKFRTVKY
jgi:hypothetical protein